ncbi:hypothetical protein BGW36DRAFT_430241 [Talaromyces proteolyticus]|uniref:Oxidase ustYa n=1 Tax=Talaromyces proteolyticus TaxID=1131652 RepID=A0AAD4PW66_9EURO|nr:uncharacterized protein BGW36DRAFT_430241 [Talaromyces proteolyticus]KAH8694222.1 hypothetical protein BGW36DRAFT_430241 [Talaromyces proteolyticus]
MDRLISLINAFKEEHSIRYNAIAASSEEVNEKTNKEDDGSSQEMPIWRPSRLQCIISITTAFAILVFSIIAFAASRSNSPVVFSADMVPQGNPVVRTFEDTFAFGGPRNNRTDAAWDGLLPTGGGFIPVPNPEAYGLPSDIRQENQLWGISVFHQLHCLILLRRVHYNFVKGTPSDPTTVEHSGHCFDFLRQAISCYGDTTLEMPQLRAEDNIDRATFNSPRKCRDFESIKEYTETTYSNFVR